MRTLNIIINWQHYELTIECLQKLRPQINPEAPQPVQIALIENGSSNDSSKILTQYLKENFKTEFLKSVDLGMPFSNEDAPSKTAEIYFIQSSQNTGFSGGVNMGAKLAVGLGFDYCLLLNNDAELPAGTLANLVEASIAHGDAIVGPALKTSADAPEPYFLGKRWPLFMFGCQWPPKPTAQGLLETAYVEGSCMLLPTALLKRRWDEEGYVMDDRMFLYCEDVDLCLYARSKGIKSLVIPKAVAYHGISQSSGGQGNTTAYYYITRNRILLATKWMQQPLRCIFNVYYVLSRILILASHFSRDNLKVSKAIYRGFTDGYLRKFGVQHHVIKKK